MVKTDADRLVAAAAERLDSGGVDAVTLRGVGDEAGVSRGAPYRHFASKAELLAAVAAAELDRLDEAFAAGGPAETRVRRMLLAYLHWARAYPERFRLVFGRWAEADPRLAAAAGRVRARFLAAVAEAQELGRLPPGDPTRLGVVLLAAAHGVVSLALAGHLGPGRIPGADLDDLVTDLLDRLSIPPRER